MDVMVLGYWAARGVAQPIRLLLEYFELEWKDVKWTLKPDPESDATFWDGTEEVVNLLDFPTMPYLIDGDVTVTHVEPIMRYLCRNFEPGLLGSTEEEKVRVNLLAAEWADFNAIFSARFVCEDYTSKDHKYYKEVLPEKLDRFADFLDERIYFAGDNLTFVDFLMYELFSQHKRLWPYVLVGYENLVNFVARFESVKPIRDYIISEHCMKYPIY